MKHKKKISCLVFLFLGLGVVHAQEAATAAGGEATGISGIASYSMGQVFYTAIAGVNGSAMHGVQQSYDISTTLGIEDETIALELSVYPNPTADYLNLKVDDADQLTYQLYNSQGRMLGSNAVRSNSTSIDLASQPSATYFLIVLKDGRKIKTFKVIKNN
ncbi:MAG: hypothetical protein ACJAR3_001602 [Roseivirga sp.]|jgi:hypothetical protein